MKKKTNIGQMNKRIDIMNVADAPFGTHSLQRTLTVAMSRWAKVIDYTGVAQRTGRGISESITHRFIIRKGPTIDNNNLIRWEGSIYKIHAVQELSSERDEPHCRFLGIDTEYQGTEHAYEDPSPEYPETLVVSGAGEAAWNQTFTYNGEVAGKVSYVYEVIEGAFKSINWSGVEWHMTDEFGNDDYKSIIDSPYPPTGADDWEVLEGTGPAPVIAI